MQLLPGAEPYRLDGGPTRVLLLHGFGSTPFELRYLAEKLQAAGFTCVCPLLPGHGTRPEALTHTRWQDWFATAEHALERLCGEADGAPVAVVGQSLGALLGLRLAALHPEQVAALCCLATPLAFSKLSGLAVAAYRYSPLRFLKLNVPRSGGVDIREPRLRRGLPSYDRLPLKAAVAMDKLQGEVSGLLGTVRAPLLALHGAEDHTAPPESAEQLIEAVGSEHKALELMPHSYHVVSLDVEKAQVADRVRSFLEQYVTKRRAPRFGRS